MTMEELKELLTDKKAVLKQNISEDKGRYNDPFLGQFMRGRVAVEEHWAEFCDKVLEIVDKL